MSPDAIRANYGRIRAEVGDGVTIVAATKYVALGDMAALADAGVEVVGENRAQFLGAYPNVRGLMTMPPATQDPEGSRPYFQMLRRLAEGHGLSQLSMGTSQDYRVAAEEGATLVRIGSV